MPRKIVAHDGPTFHLIEYDLPPLGEQDVRVAVEFAAPKHGTEIKGLDQQSLWPQTLGSGTAALPAR